MDLANLISNYAFPVAVTAWLLYRDATISKELEKTVQQNTAAIQTLLNYLQKP